MDTNEKTFALILQKIVFDNITFKRQGMKNDNKEVFNLQGTIKKNAEGLYRVTLALNVQKQDEYLIDISVTGFFNFEGETGLDESEEVALVQRDATAVVMPYLRSEISLLTAQPEVDCIVLPNYDLGNLERTETE